MWWALSFTERDEMLMRGLGYDDAWIAWMKNAHDQNARTLITHETDTRVVEMGKAIDGHYLHNDLFRFAFNDLIPIGGTTWNNHSKFQQRNHAAPGDRTTATFAMRSVGTALQGIHATGIINDDSVGRAAQTNLLEGDGRIMESVCRWWQQTTTRFDPSAFTETGIGRQLVVGNRWAHRDLNLLHPRESSRVQNRLARRRGRMLRDAPCSRRPYFPRRVADGTTDAAKGCATSRR